MWSWNPPYPFGGLGALLGGRLFEAAEERQAHGGRRDGINVAWLSARTNLSTTGLNRPYLVSSSLNSATAGTWPAVPGIVDVGALRRAIGLRVGQGKAGGPPKKSKGETTIFRLSSSWRGRREERETAALT